MWRGLKRCLTDPRPLPRVVHILPYGVMWNRTGLWDQVTRAADSIPGAVIRKSEMSIRLPNGGTFQCGGADNPDSWRGGYADECIIDEFDDVPPSMVPLVIEPMLADRNGTLVRSGTPKGRGLLQAAYDRARTTPGYSAYLLDYTKTGALSDEAIERLRQEMSNEEFAQELECSFEAPNSGSYYGKLLSAADADGRICRLLYDPKLPVFTGWDLGMNDAGSVWWFQISPRGEWRWLEYYENSGVGLDHYAKIVMEKPYVYGKHYLPHDIEVRELTMGGRSRRQYLLGLGLRPIQVVPAANPADRVQAMRSILPKSFFDAEGCATGIKMLRAYRRQWNEKMGVLSSDAVHDAASHGSDAAGTGVQGARDPQDAKPASTVTPARMTGGSGTSWMGA